MTVYRGRREALGGGVRRRIGAGRVPPAPNNAVKKLVCSARAASRPGCPASPAPDRTIGWISPGPVIRAWVGPFANAGVANVTAAMPIPVATVVTAISLRSMSGSFRKRFTPATPQPAGRFPRDVSRFLHGVLVGRFGDAERSALAELAFQAQVDVAGPPDQGVAGSKPGRSRGRPPRTGEGHPEGGA